MTTIAVRVGREIKEISGLTKSTTCWDVVLALLKERQQGSEVESLIETNDKTAAGGQVTEESASTSSLSKSVKELAQSYVIVENWRGCEKPIPPRTRILNVWQAWGKEQKHVELSLKKSKYIRFRESGHHQSRSRVGKNSEKNDVDSEHYSLHCMSNHQKRKIRRNMRQYQRALMMKQNEDCGIDSEDVRNQIEYSEIKIEPKVEKRSALKISEEKFIDGYLADPECLIRRADRAQLISQGTFNREFCKYRRKNRHRYGSSESRQHRRHQVSHYPYSSQHDRPRSSKRDVKSKPKKYLYSTYETSSTTSTSNTSEDQHASDADDEKSVLVDLTTSTLRRNYSFNVGLGGSVYGGSGATTTATDSSTTTSGDSMTSSVGGSTSSETSSGSDYFLPELHRLSFGKATENTKNTKAMEISSNKPKKNKSILKPALSLIESFRRTNKRKSTKKNKATPEKLNLLETQTTRTTRSNVPVTKENFRKIPHEGNQQSITDASVETERLQITASQDVELSKSTTLNADKVEIKTGTEEDCGGIEYKDGILQSIQSQDIVLKNQRNRFIETDSQIEIIENGIHCLRTRALGKNYVQDTYLSGFVDADGSSTMNGLFNGPSIPVTTPWILNCEETHLLERFTKMSENIVEIQLKIEEHNRKSEILLQDMQEEVWRVSAISDIANNERNTARRAAVLMLGLNDEDCMSEDDDRHELLSVKSWKGGGLDSQESHSKLNNEITSESLHLQLETSRTELEASLYLSLRLAAEIDEVESKLEMSDYLIQKKGEDLIKYVRDLAMSEEGVPPEIWEEYGELLTTYDLAIGYRQYLQGLEKSDPVAEKNESNFSWLDGENTLYIDATSPNPTSHCGNSPEVIMQCNSSETPKAPVDRAADHLDPPSFNHIVSSPWTRCYPGKIGGNYGSVPDHELRSPSCINNSCILASAQQLALFSNLPLPSPIDCQNYSRQHPHVPSTIAHGLLPMLPIPCELMSPANPIDSDYEDLPDLTNIGPPDPSKSSKQHILFDENENSSNTDDSGNASAGSTTSFASSDGSRNSSCDGGSPRPIPTVVDNATATKQLFGRNGVLRGGWRSRFVFPSNLKQNNCQSELESKSIIPPVPEAARSKLKKPEPRPKQANLTPKNANVVASKEKVMTMQQQRLIRKNSMNKHKNGDMYFDSNNSRELHSKATKLKNVSSGLIRPTETLGQAWNNGKSKIYALEHNGPLNTNYDNDSDTGRSSLHSVDSDQVIFSETLV